MSEPTGTWSWLGHFAVVIEHSAGRIYVDPYELREKRAAPADLVLVTNPRLGHLSPEDIALVCTPETFVAGPVDALPLLPEGARGLRAGETFEAAGATVRAVPAGNREIPAGL